jgi:hypothetical protein
MALDDVVIRAMSKQPDDRYPSAGDLGRAAQAALRGETPVMPERTVATGAAATRTAETVTPKNTATRESGKPTEPTRRLTDETEVADSEPGASGGSRRWAIAAGAAALVAAVVIVVILVSGGDGSDSGTTEKTDSGATTAAKKKEKPAKPKPEPLTRSELIAKADAICATSQSTYANVRSSELEEVPDIAYATTLSGISRRGVERFQQLEDRVPPSVEPAFGRYVQAQERVMRYDRQALEAAEASDAPAYVAARERRDAEAPERYDLAREIGLEQCSLKRSA